MKFINQAKRFGAVVVVSAAAANQANAAGGLDFSAITAAVDATTIVAAISALAAIKVLPNVAKWGYNKVIGWFR